MNCYKFDRILTYSTFYKCWKLVIWLTNSSAVHQLLSQLDSFWTSSAVALSWQCFSVLLVKILYNVFQSKSCSTFRFIDKNVVLSGVWYV